MCAGPTIFAVLKGAFIQLMEICTVMLVFKSVPQLARSTGQTGAPYLCIVGYVDVRQAPKALNDGKQRLPNDQFCLQACLAVLISLAMLGKGSKSPRSVRNIRHCSCAGVT